MNERDLLKEAMKRQAVQSFDTTKMSGRGPRSDCEFRAEARSELVARSDLVAVFPT